MAEPRHRSPIWFVVSIPGDLRFVPTVRNLASRVAEQAGYLAADAETMAALLDGLLRGLIDGPRVDGLVVEVCFQSERGAFRTDVRVHGADRGACEAFEAVKRAGAPLLESVDVIHEHGWMVCRVVQRLPESPA